MKMVGVVNPNPFVTTSAPKAAKWLCARGMKTKDGVLILVLHCVKIDIVNEGSGDRMGADM